MDYCHPECKQDAELTLCNVTIRTSLDHERQIKLDCASAKIATCGCIHDCWGGWIGVANST